MVTYHETVVNISVRGSVYPLNELRGITALALPHFSKNAEKGAGADV